MLAFVPAKIWAIPAPPDSYIYTQPDGSSFEAKTVGDDFFHISATLDGRYIIQDENGWWCYAQCDEEGNLVSSGLKVGKSKGWTLAPSSVNVASLQQFRTQKRRIFAQMTRPSAVTDKKKALVILVSYSDTVFRYQKSHFVNLLTQENYNSFGATGCAKDYFKAQFGDKLDFQFDVYGPYELPKNQAYYGANSNGEDVRPEEMIIDACQAADEDVEFSQYDDNNDGIIDNVFVFYAGLNEASGGGDNSIWPHTWYVKGGAKKEYYFDNVLLDRYACTSELKKVSKTQTQMASIGTFCHEFSHVLGLMDYYDTDYAPDNGYCGTGCWFTTALMDAGDNNNSGNTPPNYNAMDRYVLSDYFGKPELLTPGSHVLSPLSAGGKTYYLPTNQEGEIFLFECRDNTSWDKYINGKGLLIYHMNFSHTPMGVSENYGKVFTAYERWHYNEVNANPDYQCGHIVPADERVSTKVLLSEHYSYSTKSLSKIPYVFFPKGASEFTNASRFVFQNGEASPYSLTDIRFQNSQICFNLVESQVAPLADSLTCLSLQRSALLTWTLPKDSQAKFFLSCKGNGKDVVLPVVPYEPGKYACRIGDLSPQTFYTVQIYGLLDGVVGPSKEVKFTTMSQKIGDGYPAICLKSVKRNDDSSFKVDSAFPLELYNVSSTSSVEWYFEGEEVQTDASGYFIPGKSGLLKALINQADGTTQSVYKMVQVK